MTPRQTEASVTAERAMAEALGDVIPDYVGRAPELLAALRAAGWAVVPREATEAQLDEFSGSLTPIVHNRRRPNHGDAGD
jgi:hypothetical protein